MLSPNPQDDPFGIGKLERLDEMESNLNRRVSREASESPNNGPILGREAAIAYACVIHPSYIDQACEQLAALDFNAPIVRKVVMAALEGTAGGNLYAGDVSTLQASICRPAPSYVVGYAPERFMEALDLQAEQGRAKRLRAFR